MHDRKVIVNFIYNLVYQMTALLIPIITTPYLSRRLGADGIGQYQYVYSVVSYFTMCCILGIENYGSRECAAVRDDSRMLAEKFRGIYTVQLCASVITIAAYIVFIIADSSIRKLLICQSMYLAAYMCDITWFYYGQEQFKKIVTRNMLIKIITTVLIFVMVKDEGSLYTYCILMSGMALLSQLILWPETVAFLRKQQNGAIHGAGMLKKSITEHIKPVLALFFSIAGVNIYINIDKIMLGRMLDMTSVGIYTYSENLAKLPYGIITALTAVMLPRISRMLAQNDVSGGRKAASETMKVTLYIALPICTGIAAIVDTLIPWYYSEEFMMCIPVTRMLVVIILLIAWSGVVTSQCMVPMKMDRQLVYASIMAALVNIAANGILIPHYGIYGAVVGTVATELIVTLYKTWCARRLLAIRWILKEVAFFTLSALVMSCLVWYIGKKIDICTPTITFVQIAAGGFIYLVMTAIWYKIKKKIKVERDDAQHR